MLCMGAFGDLRTPDVRRTLLLLVSLNRRAKPNGGQKENRAGASLELRIEWSDKSPVQSRRFDPTVAGPNSGAIDRTAHFPKIPRHHDDVQISEVG